MSRVSRCIDNGPIEAFWRMLKSEMYYRRKFNLYDELEAAIFDYMQSSLSKETVLYDSNDIPTASNEPSCKKMTSTKIGG